MAAKDKLAALLRAADIEIDGSDPWDLRVLDDRFFARVLAQGTLGAGESYMDGWWDVARLDECFTRIHQARIDRRLVTAATLAHVVLGRTGIFQGRTLSRRVARRHYDLSNELYVAMLGTTNSMYLNVMSTKTNSPEEVYKTPIKTTHRKTAKN